MARPEKDMPLPDLKRMLATSLRKIKQNPGIEAYQPHPSQLKFHQSEAKGKLYIGGNRSGKTVGGGAEAAMRLTGKHRYRGNLPTPPVRLRGIAVDFDRGVNLIMLPELKKWIPPSSLIKGSWEDSYSKSDRILTLENGSTMEFMSYEQDVEKFAGTSRHYIWFDEECPREIFNENMARLIDTNGDWGMTMTPLIEMSWTYDTLYLPGKANELKGIEVFEVSTDDNPHISKESFDLHTQLLTEEEKETRKSGVYISFTGLVYSDYFKKERNQVRDFIPTNPDQKADRWEAVRTRWRHFQMMDHGFNNPAAILFAAYDPDGRVLIYDEIYKNKLLVKEIAQLWKDKRAELAIETEYCVGDPAISQKNAITGTSVQAEYAEHGIPIGLGNNQVQAGIVRVQTMFQEGQLIISDRCVNLLKELGKYRWDRHLTKTRDRKNLKEEPLKKDDHAMDALRYGIMSRPQFDLLVDEPVGNILNAPHTASDYDYNFNQRRSVVDEYMGSEF